MHSTACGVGASSTNIASLQAAADGLKMVHNNDDAMNKIPLKSASGIDDEERNGGELMQDTAAAEEARREQMRANLLAWMKKLTIVLICFIGIALISYVIISLCFSDWPKSTPNSAAAKNTNNNNLHTIAGKPPSQPQPTSAPLAPVPAPTASASATAPVSTTATATAPTFDPVASAGVVEVVDETTAKDIITPTTTTITRTTTVVAREATTPISHPATISTTATPTTTASVTATANITSNILTLTDEQQPVETAEFSSGSDSSLDQLAPAVAASTMPTTPPPSLSSSSSSSPDEWELIDKPENDTATFDSQLGEYSHAAVCSDKQLCSQIGSDILKRNGSAVDAAIAALLCNGLTTMQSMGIGGGLLMNVYVREERQAYSIDAREVAAFAAEPDMFENDPAASNAGPLSIAVPGEVMGYHRAHTKFGKLPWRDLVEPSLKICQQGYHVSYHQAYALKSTWPSIKNNTMLRSRFGNEETGEPHGVGEWVKPPEKLCETYKMLAENGPLDFYEGKLADMLAEDLEELGSIITKYDLQAYFADLVSSITMQLGDDILYSMPPVSSGAVVAHALSILQGFNLTHADIADDKSTALTLHRIAEALKFGFARRSELGDLRFNEVRELVSLLTSPSYGEEQRIKINDNHVLDGPHAYGAQFRTSDDIDGTSQLTVLAPNGDAVSVTSSINAYFGSGLIGPRTGIVLNNGMNDFAVKNNFFGLPLSPSNTVDQRKRAMSSMSPMLLANSNGDIRLAIGGAGGSRIIGGVVEVAARVLWLGEDLKTAIDAPRIYHQLVPDELQYEANRLTPTVLELLAQRGHSLKALIKRSENAVVCAILRNETAIYANADYRKRGGIAGF